MNWLRQDQAQQLRQGSREVVRCRGLARVVDTLRVLRARLPPTVELRIGAAGARRERLRVPPDVSVLARASDVALQVRAWRQRRGVAHVGGASGSSAP
ncbi:hypothetical protein [Tepidimonas sp.]|uniref:hypothetical protein n=1 Tax=Tepidimonas sp. TaxID=2002775 RepID=UPI0028D31CFC|nr:hypothetical protein [Tepidimonas sp.]